MQMKCTLQAIVRSCLIVLLGCSVGVSWGQTNPTPHNLATSNFSFTGFTLNTSTTYPTSMQGWTTGTNNLVGITTAAPGADQSLVASGTASTSGLSNLGANGFNFLVTGSSPNRQVGAVCLALNTSGRANIKVSWLADDQTSGATREMNITLQYRLGTTGTFTTVASSTYTTSNSSDKASQSFSNVSLPAECENQSVVQLRWITYESASQANGRDAIRLDEIEVTSEVSTTPTITTGTITGSPFCATSTGTAISVPFTTTGTFNDVFTAQLSDATGSFSGTVIDLGTSLTSPITATILSGDLSTPSGSAYRIRVVNYDPLTIGSNNGTNITINTPPTIATQPSNSSVCANQQTSFTVSVAGTVTYQWQASANGTDGWANVTNNTPTGATYSGGTSATLTVTSPTGYYYRVNVINGACTTTSAVRQLTISGTAPTFSTNPSNTAGTTGSSGSFNFTAAASGSPTYQWQYSANGSSGWANVTDATPTNVTYANGTTSTLTVNTNAATAAGTLYYRVNATENGCTGTSTTATLTLSVPDFVSISALNTAYTQNFDALGTSAGSISSGTTNNLAGLFLIAVSTSSTNYSAGDGSSNSGAAYSFGTTGNSDRAMGSLPSGTPGTIHYGLKFRNNSGQSINYLYDENNGEQWRNGGSNSANTLSFGYRKGTGITNLTSGTYQTISGLNFTAPIVSSTAAALNGNLAANSRLIAGIVDLSASPLLNGEEIMLRFSDVDDSGSDDGLSVDDFKLIALPSSTYTIPLTSYDNLYIDGSAFTAVVDANTTINRSLLINNGTLQVNAGKQLITASTSSWNFNGKTVIFKSNSTDGYASLINTAGGTITGASSVTVERFIPSKSARKNIFLASPVVGSIANGWQQQIHVTGTGTGGDLCADGSTKNSNGFDRTQTNSPSIFTYDATTASPTSRWVSIPNTTSNNTPGIGYRAVVRGPRSAGCGLLDGTISAQDAVTLAAVGTLNTGNTSVTVPASTVGNGFFLVGNPYAATIDFSAASFATMRSSNNINGSYWIYDPNNTATISGTIYSAFNAGSFTGAPTTLTNGNRIASGQAFFMQRTSGTATAVSNFFQASYIITDQQAGLFRTQNNIPAWTGFVRIRYEQTNNTYIGDAIVRYTAPGSDVSNTQATTFDAMSLNTGSNVVNTWKGSNRYSIQTRPDDFVAADTVALEVTASNTGVYQLRFSEFENTANDIFLLDALTNTVHNVKQQPLYPFTVSADPASQGSSRFKLVFRTNATLPVNFSSIAAKRTDDATAQIQWTVPSDVAIHQYTIERSNDGKRFEAIGSIASKQQQQPATYQFTDAKATQSMLYYRVKAIAANGAFRYSAVAKLNGKASNVAVQVYPNPVTDVVNVVLPSVAKATSYRIVDATGKVVATQQVQALPGSTLTINAATLAKGAYYLTIVLANGDTAATNFVK